MQAAIYQLTTEHLPESQWSRQSEPRLQVIAQQAHWTHLWPRGLGWKPHEISACEKPWTSSDMRVYRAFLAETVGIE